MRFFDRLARGIRIFRVQADMRDVATELRGIRLALECICREAFNVELAPTAVAKPPKGAETAYAEDGGADDLTLVRRMMADRGILPEPAGEDPIPEPAGEPVVMEFDNDPTRPFPAFAHNYYPREEPDDDTDSLSIPTARRATASGAARTGGDALGARPAALRPGADDPDDDDPDMA